MSDEQTTVDNRHWWQKKTNWGLIITGLSIPCYLLPFTAPIAPAMNSFGLLLAGYGWVDRKTK